MDSKKIASWAKSMAQLMEQKKVSKLDIEMLLDAHGLDTPNPVYGYMYV